MQQWVKSPQAYIPQSPAVPANTASHNAAAAAAASVSLSSHNPHLTTNHKHPDAAAVPASIPSSNHNTSS